jgi:hypothetical protein
MNGADWTERYPRIVEEAARIKIAAIIDAEVVCTDEEGRADFDRLHSRCFEHEAIACAFDLLRLDGDDLRRLPLSDRGGEAAEAPSVGQPMGIQCVETAAKCTRPPANSGWKASSRQVRSRARAGSHLLA